MKSRYRARGTRKDQLLLHQVHAIQHVQSRHGLIPPCTGAFPNLKSITHFPCPACGARVPRDDAHEDHAPIRSAGSGMGPATTCVLTCQRCNNGPGETYEALAALGKEGTPLDPDIPGTTCAVHGRPTVHPHRDLDLLLVREGESAAVQTDFKAGFLLAFAALGYTWAFSAGLVPIRAALLPGADTPHPRHGYIMRATFPDSPFAGTNMVLEVFAPERCIVVHSAAGVSVVLPAVGGQLVPAIDGRIKCRSYPWPDTARTGRDVDKAHVAGHLFHLDFCNVPRHLVQPGRGR